MTTQRERFAAVLRKNHNAYASAGEWREGVLNQLLAAIERPTREELQRCISRHTFEPRVGGAAVTMYIEPFLDELIALYQPEPPKEWCKHIRWETYGEGYWMYEDTVDNGVGNKHSIRFHGDWRCCPVCATPRPTR